MFCKEIKKKHKCTNTVFIGDIVDLESISSHDKNPELPGAFDEHAITAQRMARWYQAFPLAKVCIGNHDNRVYKRCMRHGIPSFYIKNFSLLYNTPGWRWDFDFEIDRVWYEHGTGWGGQTPALTAARARLQSVVCGHHHSLACINWIAGPTSKYFGMSVGSGIDIKHPALNYAKPHLRKAMVSCGVVLDGKPYLEVM